MSKTQQIEKLERQVERLKKTVNKIIRETKTKFNLIGYSFPVSEILPPSDFISSDFDNFLYLESYYDEMYDKQPVPIKRFRALEKYLKVRFIGEGKKDFYEKNKKK